MHLIHSILTLTTALASDPGWGIRAPEPYGDVIQRVIAMPLDGDLRARAARRDLAVINLTWEDTGRAYGSALGPNISDLTLQVRERVGDGTRTWLLPVSRHPNFADETGDVPASELWVRTGNQREGGGLPAVPLTEVLSNLRAYLTDPSSLRGSGNLLDRRDTHFLVSAQHVFVPIPKTGKAEFNPVLFNYQSAPGSPAVLTLLVTRQGTSATVIENRRGDQSLQGWGQQLFFNHAGQRTVFTAERKSDVKARIEAVHGDVGPDDAGALEEGADVMMIVQVPLKHRNLGYMNGVSEGGAAGVLQPPMAAGAPAMKSVRAAEMARRSDVEQAVLGHGEDLGVFTEMNGLALERDPAFPIRVTVQFYKATSNGVVSDADLAGVAQAIDRVYASADDVGSLVVPRSERVRSTDWHKDRPDSSWHPFKHFRRFFD